MKDLFYSIDILSFYYYNILHKHHIIFLKGGIVMQTCYTVGGWIFTKTREDSSGNCYFNITHPSGRTWDYDHLFRSYEEMVAYVNNH